MTLLTFACTPTPLLTDTVAVTDAWRQAVIGCLPAGGVYPQITGYDAAGRVLAGQHRHAHWLPIPDGQRIAGLLLWSPDDLDAQQAAAVGAVRRLHRLGVTLTPVRHSGCLSGRVWRSLTPYLPSRRDTPLREMVAAECAWRGLPAPLRVERAQAAVPGRWELHRPSRRVAGRSPQPVWLRVTFPSVVEGPLALGTLSHFGLGLCYPLDQDEIGERLDTWLGGKGADDGA